MNVLLSGLLDAYGVYWVPAIRDRNDIREGTALGVYLWGRLETLCKAARTSQSTFDAHDAVKRWAEATKKAMPIITGVTVDTEMARVSDCLTKAEVMLTGLTADCEMLGWFRDTRRQFIDKGNAEVQAVFDRL